MILGYFIEIKRARQLEPTPPQKKLPSKIVPLLVLNRSVSLTVFFMLIDQYVQLKEMWLQLLCVTISILLFYCCLLHMWEIWIDVSTKYIASLAITGAIRGTSQTKLYNYLVLNHLNSGDG